MKLKDRRETENVEDRRVGPAARPYDEARQDNTFVRNEGLGPLRDIVRRNMEDKRRLALEGVKQQMDRNKERIDYSPVKPTYEPVQDTRESLERMTRPDVFTRGRYRKDIDARPPYKRK